MKIHLLILLLLIALFNFSELVEGQWKETDWDIPTIAAICVFVFLEVIFWGTTLILII